jgi:GNAT superfamily N-acetyltransferase
VPVVRNLDLARFAIARPVADDPDDRLAPEELAKLERLGLIRPAWRYAWVGHDGAVGSRVVYWGATRPELIHAIHADDAGTIDAVLAASLAELAIGRIGYMPHRAALGVRSARTEPAALEAVGFRLISAFTELEHAGPIKPTIVPPGVVLRRADTLDTAAIGALFAATRVDSGDRSSISPDPAQELELLLAYDHDPAWREVAVDIGSGSPLGMVIPVRDDNHAIKMVAVVPAARRRGIGRCLLASGTAALRRDDPTARIVAVLDDSNVAMLRTADSVGYVATPACAYYVLDRA